ncbi:MAG: hypothetical protein ACYSW3_00405 [Planctomycetota bacterium]|jgi:hypothetical protein
MTEAWWVISWLLVGLTVGLWVGQKLEANRWYRKGTDTDYGRMAIHSKDKLFYVVEESEYMKLIHGRVGG